MYFFLYNFYHYSRVYQYDKYPLHFSNLQNQPALEKDKYQNRKAFQSSPGKRIIVADYGQLELRLLASMTDCISMVEAFESGGDFHSRTSLGMFDYIQKDVENGDV